MPAVGDHDSAGRFAHSRSERSESPIGEPARVKSPFEQARMLLRLAVVRGRQRALDLGE
jgi:hypothetical protein